MIQRINRLPAWLPLLLLLAIYFWNNTLTANEENYLLWAKLFYEPNWLGSTEVNRGGDINRWLYQYFAGGLLQITTFPATALIGRVCISLLFAVALGKLVRLLQISNVASLLVFTFFFLTKQSFFAGSWMFLSFEAKGLAYPLVLASIVATLKERPYVAVLLAAAATWLHILVGGWFMLSWAIYWLWEHRRNLTKISTLILPPLLYATVVLPLIILLLKSMTGEPETIAGVNLNQIYNERNAHHAAPFMSEWHFRELWRDGLFYLIALVIITYRFIRSFGDPIIRRLSNWSLIMAVLLLLSFVVAYFDTTGAILKFYLFRQNTLLKLLLLLLSTAVIERALVSPKYRSALHFSALLLVLAAWVSPLDQNWRSWHYQGKVQQKMEELATHIQNNTPSDAVFLYYNEQQNGAGDLPYFFNRATRRRNFVSHKFVPIGNTALYNWQQRVEERNRLRGNLNYLFDLRKQYQIDYLITRWAVPRPGLQLVFSNDYYYLYKINGR